MRLLSVFFRSALTAGLLLLAGCGSGEDKPLTIAVVGADPHGAPWHGGTGMALLRPATSTGLVAFDASGRVVPGLADRWVVTDDGLTYIFRLRDATWPDVTPITGEGARAALMQAIGATSGTPLALDLASVSEVRAMAGRVIEVRLKTPMPDLLQLLAQPELGLEHRGHGWGPMRRNDGSAATTTLEPIKPEARGLAAGDPMLAGLSPLRLVVEPAARATAAFAAGKVDAVLGGSFADQPLAGAAGIRNPSLRQDPVMGLFGLQVLRTEGLLATPDGREAVAMAIDRDALAAAIAVPGWVGTTRIVAAGTEGDAGAVSERWTDYDMDSRRILAQRRVGDLLGLHAKTPTLRIALPDGPGAQLLFARLAADLQAIGVNAELAGKGEAADLRLVDSVARYARAAWFLNQFNCAVVHGAPCSAEADALAAKARAASDAATAANLWAQAEQRLTASNLYIPLGPPLRWSLVGRRAGTIVVNRWGVHPLAALAAVAK